jgi:hypothetical protein
MSVTVSLYSTENGEIARFLHDFYEKNIEIKNGLEWEEEFKNPTQSASIIGAFIDNNEKFKINMWVSLDTGFYINVTDFNADKIIRYLYERYPY